MGSGGWQRHAGQGEERDGGHAPRAWQLHCYVFKPYHGLAISLTVLDGTGSVLAVRLTRPTEMAIVRSTFAQ